MAALDNRLLGVPDQEDGAFVHGDHSRLRKVVQLILQQENDLSEIVQLILQMACILRGGHFAQQLQTRGAQADTDADKSDPLNAKMETL